MADSKQIVITTNDEIKLMDYTGWRSISEGVDGMIERFFTLPSDAPGVSAIAGGRPLDFWCDDNFFQTKDKINAISSLLSGRVIYGDVVVTINDGVFGEESRGFEYYEEDIGGGVIEEAICECWLAEDLFLRHKSIMIEKGLLERMHKDYDGKAEEMITIMVEEESSNKQKGEGR